MSYNLEHLSLTYYQYWSRILSYSVSITLLNNLTESRPLAESFYIVLVYFKHRNFYSALKDSNLRLWVHFHFGLWAGQSTLMGVLYSCLVLHRVAKKLDFTTGCDISSCSGRGTLSLIVTGPSTNLKFVGEHLRPINNHFQLLSSSYSSVF